MCGSLSTSAKLSTDVTHAPLFLNTSPAGAIVSDERRGERGAQLRPTTCVFLVGQRGGVQAQTLQQQRIELGLDCPDRRITVVDTRVGVVEPGGPC